MEIAIFAKKRTTADGKTFFSYLSTLTRKDGTKQTVSVKFRDEAGNPKPENCPMNIKFEKGSANMATREFIREDTGETGLSYTLWVSRWEPGAPFVDHSLDDFE
jgi:hypothetical protein